MAAGSRFSEMETGHFNETGEDRGNTVLSVMTGKGVDLNDL
jgi:hypothetical protein